MRRGGGAAGRAREARRTGDLSIVPPSGSLVPSFGSGTLVIQTAFLGDVVLTTPLLSVLADRHGPVDVVTTPAAASLLDHHPAVGDVVRYDKHGTGRGWRRFRQLGAELRARRYARVYLPHRSLRSAGLALWSGAPDRIGFADSPGAFSYTKRIPRPRSGTKWSGSSPWPGRPRTSPHR